MSKRRGNKNKPKKNKDKVKEVKRPYFTIEYRRLEEQLTNEVKQFLSLIKRFETKRREKTFGYMLYSGTEIDKIPVTQTIILMEINNLSNDFISELREATLELLEDEDNIKDLTVMPYYDGEITFDNEGKVHKFKRK